MTRDYDMVIQRDEDGWYVGTVPALPGCNTQARSLDELGARMREAILAYLDALDHEPEPVDFIGVQRVSVAA